MKITLAVRSCALISTTHSQEGLEVLVAKGARVVGAMAGMAAAVVVEDLAAMAEGRGREGAGREGTAGMAAGSRGKSWLPPCRCRG
jgi:hypothetical protein